ncbi:hypothetical protein HYX02_05615 [Candidatus Woesearchaeota archaeon]|nr:hypothetical protein [Candidatus Woesearchaeota archaeon]
MEQELEQLVTTNDTKLAALMRKALVMNKYYYPTLNSDISKILQLAPQLSKNPKAKEQADGILVRLDAFYSRVSFDTLGGTGELCYLVTVRDLLKEFRKAMEKLLQGEVGIAMMELDNYGLAIRYVHGLYSAKLKSTLHTIRDHPDGRDFTLPKNERV